MTKSTYVHKNFQMIPGHRVEAHYMLASPLFVLELGEDIPTSGCSPKALPPLLPGFTLKPFAWRKQIADTWPPQKYPVLPLLALLS